MKETSKKTLFLTKKLAKDYIFSWTLEDQEKLFEIISEIESKINLSYPDPNQSFILSTDASEKVIGSVLTQNNKQIGFYSFKFTESEANYTITEKVTLAILKSLYHFKPIIFNNKIIFHTDNKNLIPDKPLTSRRQR
ncbi:Retrovirus-related Pol polyprotein from transposon [Dictyocoela muelleri]|nr:Retrovirus-related Pol polyprotein from transposon [Dictyocoela muelleri]